MTFPRPSDRARRLLLVLCMGAIGLLSAIRLFEYDPVPWEWVAAFAIGTVLLVGPVTWALRDRLADDRRENLAYVAAGVALLCVPAVVGFGLLFGNLLLILDAGVLGGLVGFSIALLAERTIVPERLRGTAL